MKTVRFENGSYGIRKGYWITGYRFVDLCNIKYSWKMSSFYFIECQGTLDRVKEVLDRLRTKKYEIID